MNIINNNVTNELIIKKSKFITYLFYVENINDIDNYLNYLKEEYKDCNHICYAYIFSNKKKYNDDNEPTGTAGLPILNILEKNNLSNVLAVVIRYFGGIKLGAGGLIRAYSNSCKEALKKTEIIEYIEKEKLVLKTNYDNLKVLNNITNKLNVIEKLYEDEIIYTVEIEKEYINNFINELNNKNINYEIKKEIN